MAAPKADFPLTKLRLCLGISLHVLILDEAGLRALDPGVRRFVIGHGLGRLHCGHGPMFTARSRREAGARLRRQEESEGEEESSQSSGVAWGGSEEGHASSPAVLDEAVA